MSTDEGTSTAMLAGSCHRPSRAIWQAAATPRIGTASTSGVSRGCVTGPVTDRRRAGHRSRRRGRLRCPCHVPASLAARDQHSDPDLRHEEHTSHGTRRTVRRTHRLGDASGRRRRPARRRGQPRHGRLRRKSVRADPPRQPARVPHPALRRRGAAAPRRRRTPPALLGRLRPLPQGARRRPARVGRPHRPPPQRRARPVGVPRVVGRALQGAAAGLARRDGRRRWRRSARR